MGPKSRPTCTPLVCRLLLSVSVRCSSYITFRRNQTIVMTCFISHPISIQIHRYSAIRIHDKGWRETLIGFPWTRISDHPSFVTLCLRLNGYTETDSTYHVAPHRFLLSLQRGFPRSERVYNRVSHIILRVDCGGFLIRGKPVYKIMMVYLS